MRNRKRLLRQNERLGADDAGIGKDSQNSKYLGTINVLRFFIKYLMIKKPV